MRNTLLCTVGTSLFMSNLRNLSEANNLNLDNWRELKDSYETENWNALVNELLKIDPNKRVMGAEINTIEESKKKNWLEIRNIVFFVSDTSAGINTGYVLKKYFEGRKDLSLGQVEFIPIIDLQDERPKDFKSLGLRNLIREIGGVIQRFGNKSVAIDATGGYKAQIAVAVLIGQALDIPVYYKHERFSEIIDFPPLPISLDYDILGHNADLLTDFERGQVYTQTEIGDFDEKLKVFLNQEMVDHEKLFELNAIGQLYLTSFRLRYPKAINLSTLNKLDRQVPTFRPDHFPIGFKNYVNKVWDDNKWIKTCWSMSYHGQASIKGNGFVVRETDDGKILLGTYQDKDGFGARFRVVLSDESNESLNWAADQLNQKYR